MPSRVVATECPGHAGEIAFVIGRAAHFTIQRRAPVGPQVEEDQIREREQDQIERAAGHGCGCECLLCRPGQ